MMKPFKKAAWLLGVPAAVIALNGAQAQIFYNEKLDTQAKAAMTEYAAMRDGHLAMLKERQASVMALAERVDKAVIAAVRAERDREVVRVLEYPLSVPRGRSGKPLPGAEDRKAALSRLLGDRIQEVSGLSLAALTDADDAPPEEAALRRRLVNASGLATTGLLEEAFSPAPLVFDEAAAAKRMGAYHKYFDPPKPAGTVNNDAGRARGGNAAKGKAPKPAEGDGKEKGDRLEPGKDASPPFTYAKFCEAPVVPDLNEKGATEVDRLREKFLQDFPTDPILSKVPETDRGEVARLLAVHVCDPVKEAQNQKAFLTAMKGNGKFLALKALAGIGLSPAEGGDHGPAIDLGRSIHDLGGALDTANAETKAAQAELRRLKKEQDALQKAMKAGATADVEEAAAAIIGIVGKPPEPPAAPPIALAGAPAPGAGQAEGQPHAPADTACPGSVTLACARQTAEAYGVASFDKARESALFEIARLLADSKARADAEKTNCGAPGDKVLPEQVATATRICMTAAAMKLLGLADRAAHISAGRPGELAALGVRIADAQMRVGTTQARAAALTRRIDNLTTQRAALVNELNILLQGAQKLRDSNSDYRLALLDFGRSMDNGRLPYERANDQFTLIALNEFAAREEQVVKGRYTLIDGLLATITSSTSAGLKPAELAAFLSAIGLTTLGIAEASQ